MRQVHMLIYLLLIIILCSFSCNDTPPANTNTTTAIPNNKAEQRATINATLDTGQFVITTNKEQVMNKIFVDAYGYNNYMKIKDSIKPFSDTCLHQILTYKEMMKLDTIVNDNRIDTLPGLKIFYAFDSVKGISFLLYQRVRLADTTPNAKDTAYFKVIEVSHKYMMQKDSSLVPIDDQVADSFIRAYKNTTVVIKPNSEDYVAIDPANDPYSVTFPFLELELLIHDNQDSLNEFVTKYLDKINELTSLLGKTQNKHVKKILTEEIQLLKTIKQKDRSRATISNFGIIFTSAVELNTYVHTLTLEPSYRGKPTDNLGFFTKKSANLGAACPPHCNNVFYLIK